MPSIQLVPFNDSHLDSAAMLLATRHRRDRQHEPALSKRFAEPSAALAVVRSAWREADASGVVALRAG